jgi:hypothetical protein
MDLTDVINEEMMDLSVCEFWHKNIFYYLSMFELGVPGLLVI